MDADEEIKDDGPVRNLSLPGGHRKEIPESTQEKNVNWVPKTDNPNNEDLRSKYETKLSF